MKPLLVLLVTFVVATLIIRFSTGAFELGFAGRIAMSVMLVFTALGHFRFAKGMSRMLPRWFPAKRATVFVTGLIELAAAVGLHIASLQQLTGWLLILFFILILPANIYAAVKHLNYETSELTGPGPHYLWFRIPMQIFLIAWVYASTSFNL